MQLRPYQQEAVDRFASLLAPKRLMLAHCMGAGKTLTSLFAAQTLRPNRILIVVPALVRPHWGREIMKVFPDREVGLIDTGRKRATGLSKAAVERRDRAYAAPIQVTSYDLLAQVDAGPWSVVIIDEIHNLRNPLSKQSKMVRRLLQCNPEAAALGLSGTLIPNEVKDLWNPLDTFWPGEFGAAGRSGDISWKFKHKYCYETIRDWGSGRATVHFGFKEERRQELHALLSPLVHEVAESQVAPFLPPLFVEPLYVDEAGADPMAVALEWAEEIGPGVPHFGIYVHLKETARALVEKLPGAILITGDQDTATRDALLEQARQSEHSIVVGTTHALQEGISLSFQKAALVLEWQTAMDQVLQFLGRFARQDSASSMPTNIKIYMTPEDENRAETLRVRVEDKNSLLKSGRIENLTLNAFQQREYSEEVIAGMFSRMISSFNPAKAEWQESEDE